MHKKIALALGLALTFEAVFAGGSVRADTEISYEVLDQLEDSGGDFAGQDSQDEEVVTNDEDGSATDAAGGANLLESTGQETIEAEILTDPSEQVMPEEVGESIREIVQAAAELAEADDAGVERLAEYIEQTKEQYEQLPEEGQAVLQDSVEALDNAEVAVAAYQDAQEQLAETGTIVTDPNGLENSFRYINGVSIDESLIAVDEELQQAAELDPEDLYGEVLEDASDGNETGTDSGTEERKDAADGAAVDSNGTQSGQTGSDGTTDGLLDESTGSPDTEAAEQSDGATSSSESNNESVGSEPASAEPSNQLQTEGTSDVQENSGSTDTGSEPDENADSAAANAAASPVGMKANSSGTGDRDTEKSTQLPQANVAVVKSAAGSQLVNLDGSAETQNILTASTEVHKGIDVSYHNGSIDWDKVKKAGIEFAIIRCGHGHNLDTGGDTCWLRNIQEVERVGLSYGVYFYSYATTVAGAKKEAATTIKLLKGHKPSLPVFFDMEDHTQAGLSNSLKNKIATAYCDAIAAAGYTAGFYSYKYWIEGYMSTFIQKTNYPIWLAQYASKPTYNGDYVVWQYTSAGSVSGIPTRVDMNYWYGKLAAANRVLSNSAAAATLANANPLSPDISIAQATTADKYTQKEVLPGKWIIIENATQKQLYGFVYIPSLNKICYFDTNTGYKLFGQQKIGNYYYLFDETTGAMQVGFQHLAAQDQVVYYNARGELQFGKQRIGNYWYYFDSGSGAMKRNTFFKLTAKKKCYYDAYGHAVTGEKKIGKYYYYFNPKTCAMKTGLVKVAGTSKTCYYNAKGHRVTGFKKIKGKKYYFKPSNGNMVKKTFKKIKGKKYYFDKKGRMVTGRKKIKGKWYTFNSKGVLIG